MSKYSAAITYFDHAFILIQNVFIWIFLQFKELFS